MAALGFEVLLGALTFTGSLMAFGKLQGILPGAPITFPGQNAINVALARRRRRAARACWSCDPTPQRGCSTRWSALAFAARRAARAADRRRGHAGRHLRCSTRTPASPRAATGFALDNNVLIICGALDGASGFILLDPDEQGDEPLVHERAVRRVRHGDGGRRPRAKARRRGARRVSVEDAAVSSLTAASSVIVVPGLRHGGRAGAARGARAGRAAREATAAT